MELSNHAFKDLFEQLGLPSSRAEIAQFIATHRPLPADTALADAEFWTPAQAQFLRDEIAGDADWAELVDQLDTSRRT